MLQESVVGLSLGQFQTITSGKKLIILHPRSRHRNYYLAYFAKDKSRHLAYYCLSPEDKQLSSFLAGLTESLKAGTSKNQSFEKLSPSKLAEAFLAIVKNLPNPSLIFLDEFDHLDYSPEVQAFFEQVLKALPETSQILINTRASKIELWRDYVFSGEAVVIGDEYNAPQSDAQKPQLEVYGFGMGHAIVNGTELVQWDGILPRQLFFYFVDKPLVTRDEIFEVFWSSLNVKEATNVYHVTKRKIGEKIAEHVIAAGEYDLTQYSEGFYRPSPSIHRYYDVSAFESYVDEASMTFDDDKQASLYHQAIQLYKAPFLTSLDMPWVLERREKLQRLFMEALIALARYHKVAKRYPEALGYFIRALRENPYREDIHREVMQLYVWLDATDEARRHYHILSQILKENLGLDPAPETTAFYQNL